MGGRLESGGTAVEAAHRKGSKEPAIRECALIGDGRSVALVSRDGSIPWLCWPRFDSPSIFAAILDSERGGLWRVAPSIPFRTSRRYVEGTNVLETTFETRDGRAVLTDLMPVASERDKRRMLLPESELLRRVRVESGEVPLEIAFEPRPDFARGRARLRDRGHLGIFLEAPGGTLLLRGGTPLRIAEGPFGPVARGQVILRAEQSLDFSLTFSVDAPAVLPPLGARTEEVVSRSVAWWRSWSSRARYEGPHREAVVRSALVLKLLAYAPSGAIVAAPTTSLPERVGGDMNWDYRYCWLRDAAFTARALFGLGYEDEARAFVEWTLHATRLTRPEARIAYDVFGEDLPEEQELPHLAGHRGSRPVRIGNGARRQLQLDVYGEVMDAVAQLCASGERPDRETARLLCDFGEYVCRNWQRPDQGIWEDRGEPTHNVSSRALCWVALDRLLRLNDEGHLEIPPKLRDRFAENRAWVRDEIEARGYSEDIESYTRVLGGDEVDATALLLSWYGLEPASGRRMRRTHARLRERLSPRPGLFHRNEASRRRGEGAFGICGFWAAEHLARGGGSVGEAREAFERSLDAANDVGLMGEEVDPETLDPLGNFPQGFTHLGLINAALSLEERERLEKDPAKPMETPRVEEREHAPRRAS